MLNTPCSRLASQVPPVGLVVDLCSSEVWIDHGQTQWQAYAVGRQSSQGGDPRTQIGDPKAQPQYLNEMQWCIKWHSRLAPSTGACRNSQAQSIPLLQAWLARLLDCVLLRSQDSVCSSCARHTSCAFCLCMWASLAAAMPSRVALWIATCNESRL